jgi:hypothetical protein
MDLYKLKYEKYKLKYLELKNIIGGVPPKFFSKDLLTKMICHIKFFNEKFKEKYDITLSIINIINSCEPNHEVWDQFVEDTINFIREETSLDDNKIIKLLNNFYNRIDINIKKTNPLNPRTIQTLICEIKNIVEEVKQFIIKNGIDELIKLIDDSNDFGLLSLDEKLIEKELSTVVLTVPELEIKIEEEIKRLQSTNPKFPVKKASILSFTIPTELFPREKKRNFQDSSVSDLILLPSPLQIVLLTFSPKNIYDLLRIVINNLFSIDINCLQVGEGKGDIVIHFLRPTNNLTEEIKSRIKASSDPNIKLKLKEQLKLPIFQEIKQVGIIMEFLSRIQQLVTMNFSVLKSKTEKKDDLVKQKKGHMQIIINLYSYIMKNQLWNFVIILFNNIKVENPELFNDIGLIISFIQYSFSSDKGGTPAEQEQFCIVNLVKYVKYKSS